MNAYFDAFWRAAAYMLMPRVIGLSLLPLFVAGGLALVLGYWFWDPAVAAVRSTLEGWWLVESMLGWFDAHVSPAVRRGLAPALVIALAVPLVVVTSLFLVAVTMTPALVSLVAARRYASLEKRRGAAFWQSWLWSLACSTVALLALLLTAPLWLIPPLILLLPPLIWGWMTSKVFGFDVLAEHASKDERVAVLKAHRWQFLSIGILAGYLGAAPTLIWAAGVLTMFFAPLFVVISVWLYTLVFAFTALWFAHYGLAALQAYRAEQPIEPQPQTPGAGPPASPALLPG